MAHTFEFKVTVVVNRTQGKFAARDDIADRIREEIEGADPGSIDGLGNDGDSEYEVESFEVEDL